MSDERTDVTVTDRGFQHMAPVPGTYGGEVKVYESSSAMAPHIWLNVWSYADVNNRTGREEATVHLTLEDADLLRDRLGHLIENHYQRT